MISDPLNRDSYPPQPLFVTAQWLSPRCSGRNSDEELIDWLLSVCARWKQLSNSPFLHHGPFGWALSCRQSPVATLLLFRTTAGAPCPAGALRGYVCLWQTLNSWSPNGCWSLRAETHQKVHGWRASNSFEWCVRVRQWDGDSCVYIGFWLLLVLFQKEMGERTGDGGAQRRLGVIDSGESCRAAALGWVTGASWRSTAAASWSQALCSTTSSSSSMQLLQDRVTAWSVAYWQPKTRQAGSLKQTVRKHCYCTILQFH